MVLFDELKSFANTLRKADKIKEYQLIIDVQEQLLEKQNKIIELTEENQKLKEKDDFEKNLSFEKNAFYLIKKMVQKRDRIVLGVGGMKAKSLECKIIIVAQFVFVQNVKLVLSNKENHGITTFR